MPNALARLLRLRAVHADTARRDLALALRAQEVSGAALAASRAALRHEAREVGTDPDYQLTGAFAMWLPAAQTRVGRAQAEQAVTDHSLALARLGLADAQMALRACETVADGQAASRSKAAMRREQAVLEDSVRRAAPHAVTTAA